MSAPDYAEWRASTMETHARHPEKKSRPACLGLGDSLYGEKYKTSTKPEAVTCSKCREVQAGLVLP